MIFTCRMMWNNETGNEPVSVFRWHKNVQKWLNWIPFTGIFFTFYNYICINTTDEKCICCRCIKCTKHQRNIIHGCFVHFNLTRLPSYITVRYVKRWTENTTSIIVTAARKDITTRSTLLNLTFEDYSDSHIWGSSSFMTSSVCLAVLCAIFHRKNNKMMCRRNPVLEAGQLSRVCYWRSRCESGSVTDPSVSQIRVCGYEAWK